ncbi:outer membrane protein transport protein [Ferrimonas senticii]|uniref:outer membrane protein transport protein n=1 Tax=Ferrimonas senticii TaxID=394566 RepID=UPI0004218D74|nr:outer membrane protein transport protein [Ferrimonas senticii]
MKIRVVAAVVMGALSAQANAAGFQLAEYSATGLGRAYAGEAAMADNASSQGRNPALLMHLEGRQLSAGLVYVDPNIDSEGKVNGKIPADADDFAPSAVLPNFYYSNKVNDNWAYGISLNASHGMATELPKDHAAAIFGSDVGIEAIELVPAVAYQLTDTVAVGAGVRVIYGKGHVTATAPTWFPLVPAGTELKSVDGDGFDFGYQLGATWQPSADRRLGFNYRSEVDLKLEGNAVGMADKSGSLTLPLPATAELAGFHQLTDKFAMHASVNWTNWSAFKTLTVDLDSGVSDKLKDENFKDNWRYALGATYQVNDKLVARTGVALDEGAATDEYRTLSIPDSDRLWFSAGVGYQATENLNLDLSLTYIKAKDASITNEKDKTTGAVYNGEISGDVYLVGVQASYRF